MLDLADINSYELFRPLVKGWLSKVEAGISSQARKKWREIGDECLLFYSRSAAAMWDPLYTKKFWRGVKAPRFRITINKAFEYVAVYLPNLLWDVPHRTATSKKLLEIPQELFPDSQVYEALMRQASQETAQDKLIGHLMEGWLNYTPREQPEGGLTAHNEHAVLDAMLRGSGLLFPSPYSFPSSERTLTGCFRKPPEDLIYDPDFKTAGQCKWAALKHVEPHWAVEDRFKLPRNSLKNKASLESSWHYAEAKSQDGESTGDRKSGKTNDLVIWYEIWSRLGVGARMTGMPDMLKGPLDELVGNYAYLAICPDCPYPLNCPADLLRSGAPPEAVRKCFEWPVPLWPDQRWPFESLIFYLDPDSPYGIPPLAPALGELKAINAIVSWLVNRTWQSSRQMWAVLGQYHDDMKKVLEDGEDMGVFAIPVGADQDIKKVIQLLDQKEVNKDSWAVLELLSNIFDKRMGMTPFVYGQNEGGTQDRTAETTNARKQAVGVRPEYMQKKVVEWQSRVAGVEAMIAWLFVKSADVQPLFGQAGAMLWQQYIENADHELVMRQMRYEVAASSIRRPNREKDMADFNEYLSRFLPVVQEYGQLTGDFSVANGATKHFGDLHDMDMEQLFFPAKDPNSPEAQLQQRQQQAEIAKVEAEAQKLQGEAQANTMAELQMEAGFRQQELQQEQQAEVARLQIEIKKMEAELAAKAAELQLKMEEGKAKVAMSMQQHAQEMQQRQAEGQVDLEVKREIGATQIAQGRQQMTLHKEKGAADVAVTKAKAKAAANTKTKPAK